MIEFPLINQVLVFLINAITLWLAFLVYHNNPKGKMNRLFIGMALLMLFWVNFAYLARVIGQDQIHQSLLFIKIAWFVTPLLFTLLSLLTVYLIKEEKRYWVLNKLVLFLGVGVAFITGFTSLVIQGIGFEDGNLIVLYGKGMLLFLGIVMFLMCATLYPLFRKYFSSLEKEKKKIEFFLIGIFVFYLANIIFNIVLPITLKVSHFYYIGDYSTIFLLVFTAYAIVKHELFGIKVVLTTLFVGLMAILLLLDALVFTPDILAQLFKGLILVVFLCFGYLLVKSVLDEIKRSEELERLGFELARANAELKRISKSKTEFLSMASHQLRTPLTAIKGYTSMLVEGSYGKFEKKAGKVLKNILISTERLTKITNDLLSISRIELGKLKLEKAPCQIEVIIDSVYKEMKPDAQNKRIKLIWQRPKILLPKINIDGLKIRQVLYNMVDNAIKYTNSGYVSITLKSRFQIPLKKDFRFSKDKAESKQRGRIIIEVKDTGEGLTEEEQSKIFHSFARGAAGFTYWIQGSGLGLYLAKKFIEMHHGRLWVESQGRGKGSAFYIELPVR